MAGCGAGRRYRRRAEPKPIRNHAVERGSFLYGFHGGKRYGAQGAQRTVSNLLAADFRLYLPPRLRRARRSGFNSGFSSYGD